MANEEKMNVDIENQENFAKKKKITIICLSAGLVFITLIAGLLLVKKNKESCYENNDLREVVDEDHENNDDNDHENDDVIVNEGDYFFNKISGQIIENIILFLGVGILLFFWENDKNIGALPHCFKNGSCKKRCTFSLHSAFCGNYNIIGVKNGAALFSKYNWFSLATFVSFINTTLLVEFILNHLLLGSLTYLFSKDKNKRYFHTLETSWRKRKRVFSSFSKTKTFLVIFSYLLYGFIIVIAAKLTKRCCVIIKYHHATYCCWCCRARSALVDD